MTESEDVGSNAYCRVFWNNFNSLLKAILVLFLYEPPVRVRSGEAALNCPGIVKVRGTSRYSQYYNSCMSRRSIPGFYTKKGL